MLLNTPLRVGAWTTTMTSLKWISYNSCLLWLLWWENLSACSSVLVTCDGSPDLSCNLVDEEDVKNLLPALPHSATSKTPVFFVHNVLSTQPYTLHSVSFTFSITAKPQQEMVFSVHNVLSKLPYMLCSINFTISNTAEQNR